MPYFIPQVLNENSRTPAGGVCTLEYINGYTCPESHDLVNNVCVLKSDTTQKLKLPHSIAYDFEYYENGGELVGKYKYETALDNSCSIPVFCDQNVLIKKIGDMPITNKTMAINADESVIKFDFNYNSESGELEFPNWSTSNPDNVFYHGQFYLLPNHPLSLKKINFHYDLIESNSAYPLCTNAKSVLSDIPYDRYTINPLSFIELYIGIAMIPASERANGFSGIITPTLEDVVYGTEGIINWNQLSDDCFRWFQIYDKADLNDQLGEIGQRLSQYRPSQYIINFKTVIKKEVLSQFIKNNFNDIDMNLSLLFYPISTYLYPCDIITSVEYPVSNSINKHINHIIFKLPNNYKTDGNIQFKIDFLSSSYGDIIFTSSSYDFNTRSEDALELYEDSIMTRQNYEQYCWYVSDDKRIWRNISNDIPLFKNEFSDISGADADNNIYIKYQLSDEAKQIVLQKQTVLFRISQLDGTLTEI